MSLSKISLSGSRNGMPITIIETVSPGNIIHTAVNSLGTATWDEIWIYANNIGTAVETVTIRFGGIQQDYNQIVERVAYNSGLVLIIPGLILQNAYQVTAYVSTALTINLTGYVNAIRE